MSDMSAYILGFLVRLIRRSDVTNVNPFPFLGLHLVSVGHGSEPGSFADPFLAHEMRCACF